MNLDIKHFPSQLLCVVSSVWDILFPLLNILNYFLVQIVFFPQVLELRKRRLDNWIFFLNLFEKSFNCLVADVLTNNKLVFSDLLVRVVVVFLFFSKVYSHAAKELSWERAYFLI